MVNYLKTKQHYLRLQKTKFVIDNVFLRYFETQPGAIAKQLHSHDTLALIDIKLIHKLGEDNVVLMP
jgi:hypothetical protein